VLAHKYEIVNGEVVGEKKIRFGGKKFVLLREVMRGVDGVGLWIMLLRK